MPTIDELAPRYVREKKIDISLDPESEEPKANRPLLLTVSYARAMPDGVALPLIMEVQGPNASSYRRVIYDRVRPTTLIVTPREGGRHLVVLREAAHNRWWGSVALEVAGEKIEQPSLDVQTAPLPLPAEPLPPPPPSGPSTTPSWIAVGTRDSAGTSSAAPAYGTNQVGDLFVMVIAGRITSVTTPSGWTLRGGPNDQAGRKVYIFTRDARSAGGESGTVAVTLTADSQTASIHTFRAVALNDYVEDVTNGGTASNGNTLNGIGITAGGNHRLGVFACGSGTNTSDYDSLAGATGGTWTLRDELGNPTGTDSSYCLQTAPLDAGGTISGGSDTVNNIDEHSVVGFALVGV